MKFLITNLLENKILKDLPKSFIHLNILGFTVIAEENFTPGLIDGKLWFLEGYLKDHNIEETLEKEQGESVFGALSKDWPLPENYSGSFSSIVVDQDNGKVTLATDLIGLYPIYYLTKGENFYFSNSIILTGLISGAEIDPSGVAQRCLGPDFFNLGSRTILEGCKRLLPGECRKYDLNGNFLSTQFDNSLYQNLTGSSQDHSLAKTYWKSYQKEVKYCLNGKKDVNIALSGGMDSRVVLAAIPEEKKITCYTFGNKNNYESKVAGRLAKLKGGKFLTCYQPDLYFPSPELLREYTLKTEGLELCSWLEITENASSKIKEPLLLGELCEALPARKIEKFNSRKFRRKNFIKYYLFKKDYKFEVSTKEKFEEWKEKKKREYSIYYFERNLARLDLNSDLETLNQALFSDLDEIFERIEAHNLQYIELYDELFSWYTYTRMRLSKQLLTANRRFHAYSPAMSLKMLRLTSSIHPNLRLNYRFIRKLFTENTELRKYYRIPTNQSPFFPQGAPDTLKFAVWGIRSLLDQFLIKRLMKARDPGMRYRILPSINWVQIYQLPQMEKYLNKYFENNYLGKDYVLEIKDQALQRKDLKAWPFANMNIINAAALNTELDLIYSKKI